MDTPHAAVDQIADERCQVAIVGGGGGRHGGRGYAANPVSVIPVTRRHARYPLAVPFVLGGSLRWRPGRDGLRGWAAVLAVLAVVALPLRGLYRGTGASMEEGFMLVFPNLVREGKVPNVDFLHLYGPASLDSLALWFRVFGDSLESQRTFGLLQHLGVIFGIYALCRVAGHVAAAGAAIVATFLIITPIGLSALAWHGALALGLWATVFGVRARFTGSVSALFLAGGLGGLALGFRPDLAVALILALAWIVRAGVAATGPTTGIPVIEPVETTRPRERLLWLVGGALIGLLPIWAHFVRAGIGPALDGMLVDPVVRLRPGRSLPRPPTWDRVDGALQAVAESLPPWWRFPALAASKQLFLWFWAVTLASVGVAALAVWRYRRASADQRPTAFALAAGALFGLGILPQALQRPDSTHLAWVAVVSWSVLVAIIADAVRPRLGCAPAWSAGVIGTAALAVVMFVVCPFFTYRTYLLHTRVAVGDLPLPYEIVRGDHRFWVGDPAVARAITAMMPELEARSEPGDRLFVGPGDLRRTIYADTYIYWLFSELEPATYYIEMDPGLADQAGSGLADDIASADFVVLTNTWGGWTEPNASNDFGSPEHNQAVADGFCLVASYETNLVLLFERCAGGGGLNPADLAGRAPGIGGGGIERP